MMTLEKFLEQLVGSLDRKAIAHCVLRNYKGLPYQNPGNDIDILVNLTDKHIVRKLVSELAGVRVTGYLERPYVITVYFHGVEWGEDRQAIEIDFVLALSWKGLPYLDVEAVLNSAVPGKDCAPWIRTPSPEHEATISFFASYLIGGFIKDRYLEFIRSVFETRRDEVEKIMSALFGPVASRTLINSVILDDRKNLLSKLPQLRRKLFLRSFVNTPLLSARRLIEHYKAEIVIRHTYRPMISICLLGPDGAGKSSVIKQLEKTLRDTAKEVYTCHLKPRLFWKNESQGPVIDPHGKPSRSVFLSTIKIWVWALELFIDRVTHGATNVSLLLWDRYYHDLLVDPKRYRYGGPMWLARWVGKLIPKPGIWILLDAPPETLQNRKQEVPFEETARQREGYVKLVRQMKNGFVVDASQNLDQVVADIEAVILKFMVEKTGKYLA